MDQVLLASLLAAGLVCLASGQEDVCAGNQDVVADPDSCRQYYVCTGAKPVLRRCSLRKIYSEVYRECVDRDRSPEECDRNLRRTRNEFTSAFLLHRRNPSRRYPHPRVCSLYYDYTFAYSVVPRFFRQYLRECPYPKLFSELTLRCEPYQDVDCGSRKETKAHCQYRQYQCGSIHCLPCRYRYPSCVNRPNGYSSLPHLRWGPQYIECQNERLVGKFVCSRFEGSPMVFSPFSRRCISVFAIPSTFGAHQPDCRLKGDGFYPDPSPGHCRSYFECFRGNFTEWFQCENDDVFGPLASTCVDKREVCPPCGISRSDSCLN